MITRDFQEADLKEVKDILFLYWNDPEFLKELSDALCAYIAQNEECKNREYTFLVAEENNTILGVIGFRNTPEYMKVCAETKNPGELYILATKHKEKGIGKELWMRGVEKMKDLGFTEVLLYSPTSHKESWGFYEKMNMEKAEAKIPEEDQGQVWRKIL